MKIIKRVAQQFCEHFTNVSRHLIEKPHSTRTKAGIIKREATYPSGHLLLPFRAGTLHEDKVKNSDETNFLVNFDNRTLDFPREEHVK